MLDAAAINQILAETVPFNAHMGPVVESVSPQRSVVILPESPERLNHVGTTHAVAQFGLGEVTSGALIAAAFWDLQHQGYAPVVTNASVTYLKPARGQLRGEASLSAAEQERIRNEITAGGRPRFAIDVQLFDLQGTLTTELRFEWMLLAPRATAEQQG
ncbi:MAG: YiiD C-terminal domain-containing protein [Ktedonobacterales bacterium]